MRSGGQSGEICFPAPLRIAIVSVSHLQDTYERWKGLLSCKKAKLRMTMT